MGEVEKRILFLLNKSLRYFSLDDIMNILGDKYDISSISAALANLEKKGKIYRNKKNQYLVWNKGLNRMFGKIIITKKGTGIIRDNLGAVTIVKKQNLNGVISGDSVIVKDLKDKGDYQEGKVERIMQRGKQQIVCEVTSYGSLKRVIPIDYNTSLQIRIPAEQLNNSVNGDRVLVEVGLAQEGGEYLGRLIEKICHKDDPNSDLITIAAMHGFSYKFPDEVEQELESIPVDITHEDVSDRVDLRDKIIFTIDGEDTKDIDDAISLEILPNGNYKLGVHIADVAHYVKKESAIYKEALKRGVSLYLLDKVFPMLPRRLSNGICSLNPDEDRLTKTCEMEIDRNGNIISSRIFNSVIRSRKKMSYEAVNEILENGQNVAGYEEYVEILEEMNYLSAIMTNRRILRGAIEFGKREQKIKTDNFGNLVDIKVLSQKSAENIIENFMLACNESVALTFGKDFPFLFRVHDLPNKYRLNKTINAICHINQNAIKPNKDMSSSYNIQLFLQSLKGMPEYQTFSNMLLRCMSKAEYSERNIGHFGLALKYYTHFTSPIRRFSDLLIHQLIDKYQKGHLLEAELADIEDNIGSVAISVSNSEIEAQNAENDANAMAAAEYMSKHIGEDFRGQIIDISERGMHVVLENLIEGYVNVNDILPKNKYNFDRNGYYLVSNNEKYCLGDEVLLKVKSANKAKSQISFTVLGHLKKEQSNKKVKVINNG